MARRQRPVRPTAPDDAPPTPETVAKLRRDVVATLESQGRLRAEHLRAALEVRRVWEAFGRGLFASARRIDGMSEPRRRAMFVDPIERLSPAEEIAWRTRYRPWAREMAVTIAAGTIRTSRLQLVLDVVVDNNGTRQVEAWYRMRHGTAVEHVRAALARYAEIAGWVATGAETSARAPAYRVREGTRMPSREPIETPRRTEIIPVQKKLS